MADPITIAQAKRASEDASYMKKTVESPFYSEVTPDGVDKRTISGMNTDVDNAIERVDDAIAELASAVVTELEAASLSAGTTYDNITYSTNLVDEIKGYIFDATKQITYAVPEEAQGKFIQSVIGGVLTTTDTSEYRMLSPLSSIYGFNIVFAKTGYAIQATDVAVEIFGKAYPLSTSVSGVISEINIVAPVPYIIVSGLRSYLLDVSKFDRNHVYASAWWGDTTKESLQSAVSFAKEFGVLNVSLESGKTYSAEDIQLHANLRLDLTGSTIQKTSASSHAFVQDVEEDGFLKIIGGEVDGLNNSIAFRHLIYISNSLLHVTFDMSASGEWKNNLPMLAGTPILEMDNDAIYINKAASAKFKAPKINTIARNGISITDGCPSVKITDPIIRDCHLSGVDLEPNNEFELMFERVTVTGGSILNCGNTDVWDGGGAFAMLTTSGTRVCKQFTFKGVDIGGSGTATNGDLFVGLRVEGADNITIKDNNFDECQILINVAGEGHQGSSVNMRGKFTNTQIACFGMKTIKLKGSEFSGELTKIQLQTNSTGDNQLIDVDNVSMSNCGERGGIVEYVMRLKGDSLVKLSDVTVQDSRLNTEVPYSIFFFGSGSKVKTSNIEIIATHSYVVDPNENPSSLNWSGGSVISPKNLLVDFNSIDEVRISNVDVDISGDLLADNNGGLTSNISVTNIRGKCGTVLSCERLNDSVIRSIDLTCTAGINIIDAVTQSVGVTIAGTALRGGRVKILADPTSLIYDNISVGAVHDITGAPYLRDNVNV